MNVHKNARLSQHRRAAVVRRVIERTPAASKSFAAPQPLAAKEQTISCLPSCSPWLNPQGHQYILNIRIAGIQDQCRIVRAAKA